MAQTSKIEWTEATWNPWYCCHKISPGCKNCYMFDWARRAGHDPNVPRRSKTKFYDPLKWKEPKLIFTCSLSDFFIEEADAWRDEAFAIMALTPQHTYQVLTKRPERMREYFDKFWTRHLIAAQAAKITGKFDGELGTCQHDICNAEYPYRNVWLGVSVEDQKTADERIPLLLDTPAAIRWISAEPLLGPLNVEQYLYTRYLHGGDHHEYERLDWGVIGGESGPNARPMHPDWARSLRTQFTAAGVPFFFKQWGEFVSIHQQADAMTAWKAQKVADLNWRYAWQDPATETHGPTGDADVVIRVGKHKAGRLLDGREWSEMPKILGI